MPRSRSGPARSFSPPGQRFVDHPDQVAGIPQCGGHQVEQSDIRFISDPSAQVASLLSGDVDAFPRIAAARSLPQFKSDPRFVVLVGGSKAKVIVAINARKKPFDDVRVRRAILAAIDRKAMIEGAVDGFGVPIGSFYTPGSLGYVDTTDINPFDIEKARKLLAEAGVKTPLEVSLKLPPGLCAAGR